jgi:hypothetical protein
VLPATTDLQYAEASSPNRANLVDVPEDVRTPDPPRQPAIRAISLIQQFPTSSPLQGAIREMR